MEFTLNTDDVHVQDFSCAFRSVHMEKSYPVKASSHSTIFHIPCAKIKYTDEVLPVKDGPQFP